MPILVFALVIGLVVRQPLVRLPALRPIRLDYSIAPLLGVFILLLTYSIGTEALIRGIVGTEAIRPYSILILFNALAYVCISLDRTGFFAYLSLWTIKKAGRSGRLLFLYFFILSSVLTMFTSNDIVILTLTPLICYFTRYTKTDPIPYLIAQFFAANIWSVALYVGNPTNIIVAEAYKVGFVEYSRWMLLPSISAGLVCLALIWAVFKHRIPVEIEPPNLDPESALKDKPGAVFGVACLATCLLLLSCSFWLEVDIWKICLGACLVMLARDAIADYRRTPSSEERFPTVSEVVRKMPWKTVPFVIGMFTLVEALNASGWVTKFAGAIAAGSTGVFSSVFTMSFLSSLAANLMNNQPMTILFTQITQDPAFALPSAAAKQGSMYALIMGSNFGANLTLIGALAGIMWSSILNDKGVAMSFRQFTRYGLIIMPAVIAIASLVLSLEIVYWF